MRKQKNCAARKLGPTLPQYCLNNFEVYIKRASQKFRLIQLPSNSKQPPRRAAASVVRVVLQCSRDTNLERPMETEQVPSKWPSTSV